MLWGQKIKVFTDHKNLIRDALGLTFNRVYWRRLLLEEYAPEIVYIKGIHSTVADSISQLEYNPEVSFANLEVPTKDHCWKGFTSLWCPYNEKNPGTHEQDCNWNHVFADCSNEDKISSLTAQEVADAQRADSTLKHCVKRNHVFHKGINIRLVNETFIVCKDDRMIIPKPLQRSAVLWFHHYLQHPGHMRLEETM